MYHIEAINAFDDNYIWIIHNQSQAIIVDPGEAAGVDAYLNKNNLTLIAVLVTHWHPDHIGGLTALRAKHNMTIYGPDDIKIPDIDCVANPEASIDILDLKFKVITVPGHTLEHIAYYNAEQQLLFCGDTLFSGGCGRMFEGTAAMYTASLEKLKNLPTETQIFCAHEYTLANLQFAQAVEPQNQDIQQYTQSCVKLRENKAPTLPATLGNELKINPFLRLDQPSVIQSALINGSKSSNDHDIFAQLREWKNNF